VWLERGEKEERERKGGEGEREGKRKEGRKEGAKKHPPPMTSRVSQQEKEIIQKQEIPFVQSSPDYST
jgi:hypothetical protein